MSYDIHTFGTGPYLSYAFDFVKMLVGGTLWGSLVRLVGILSIMIYLLSTVQSAAKDGKVNVTGPWGYLMLFAFVYLGLLTPKADVVIIDHNGGGVAGAGIAAAATTSSYNPSITDVPLAVAFIANMTSTFGYKLAEEYDNLLTPIDNNNKFSRSGLLFAHRLIDTYTNTVPVDPILTSNMRNLFSKCIYPEIARGNMTVSDFVTSTDIISEISSYAKPGRFVEKELPSGSTPSKVIVSCSDLYSDVSGSLTTTQEGDRIEKIMGMSQGSLGNMDTAVGDMMKITAGAAQKTRQTMAINVARRALQSEAVYIDNQTLATMAYQDMAEQQQFNAYRSMGHLAGKTVPMMRGLVEALTIVLFPVVALMLLLPTFLVVVGTYVKVVLWIQLWPLLYAILNSIMVFYSRPIGSSVCLDGAGASLNNFTFSCLSAAQNYSTDMVAMAGFLSISIPMISWMIVNGGGNIAASVATGLAQPAQQAASQMAGLETQGRMDSGRMTMNEFGANTMRMNTMSTASSIEMGAKPMTIHDSGTSDTFGRAGRTYNQDDPLMSVDNTAVSTSVKSSNDIRAQNIEEAAFSSANKFSDSLASAASLLNKTSNGWGFDSSTLFKQGGSSGGGSGSNISDMTSLLKSLGININDTAGNSASLAERKSSQVDMSTGLSGSVNPLGSGSPVKAQGEVGIRATTSAGTTNEHQASVGNLRAAIQSMTTSEAENLVKGLETFVRGVNEGAITDASGQKVNFSEDTMKALNSTIASAKEYSAALSEKDSFATTRAKTEEFAATSNLRLENQIIGLAEKEGINAFGSSRGSIARLEGADARNYMRELDLLANQADGRVTDPGSILRYGMDSNEARREMARLLGASGTDAGGGALPGEDLARRAAAFLVGGERFNQPENNVPGVHQDNLSRVPDTPITQDTAASNVPGLNEAADAARRAVNSGQVYTAENARPLVEAGGRANAGAEDRQRELENKASNQGTIVESLSSASAQVLENMRTDSPFLKVYESGAAFSTLAAFNNMNSGNLEVGGGRRIGEDETNALISGDFRQTATAQVGGEGLPLSRAGASGQFSFDTDAMTDRQKAVYDGMSSFERNYVAREAEKAYEEDVVDSGKEGPQTKEAMTNFLGTHGGNATFGLLNKDPYVNTGNYGVADRPKDFGGVTTDSGADFRNAVAEMTGLKKNSDDPVAPGGAGGTASLGATNLSGYADANDNTGSSPDPAGRMIMGAREPAPNVTIDDKGRISGEDLDRLTDWAGRETGVDSNLLKAMMKQESSGNFAAVSPKGAAGLMQLMPETAEELGVTNRFDPAQNVLAGARYMSQQLDRYDGNLDHALSGYNAGPGKTNQLIAEAKSSGGPVSYLPETRDYISRVKSNYVNYEAKEGK